MVFAGLATLRHIARTDWIGVFYYNADSLVLPLVERSIHHGEAFQWVFSSQNFFFPEGAFFFLSTLFTDNPRVALSINAVLNLVALYALLRVIAHVLSRHSRHRLLEICIALGAALLFVVFVLLEPIASPNGSGIATPFLFTTYYYGVVLGGLGMLALVLWVTNAFSGHSIERRKKIIFLGAAALLTALVTFSNPLYIFQVIAPLWVTLLILIFMTRVGWRFFLQTIAATGGAVIVAFGIRALMPQLFAAGVSRYQQHPDEHREHLSDLQRTALHAPGRPQVAHHRTDPARQLCPTYFRALRAGQAETSHSNFDRRGVHRHVRERVNGVAGGRAGAHRLAHESLP